MNFDKHVLYELLRKTNMIKYTWLPYTSINHKYWTVEYLQNQDDRYREYKSITTNFKDMHNGYNMKNGVYLYHIHKRYHTVKLLAKITDTDIIIYEKK